MLIWPESIGLTAGFKTHPDELAFMLCDEVLTKDFDEKIEVPAWSASSRSYPAPEDDSLGGHLDKFEGE